MGNKVVTLTDEQLENYQDCTFFTRKEILRVFKKFREVRPDLIPKEMPQNEAVEIRIPLEDIIEKLPELHENPFKKRICQVFSRDGNGDLSFEDFLDLLSIFSEQAPRDLKVFYAFRIYDFDNDDHIGPEDINEALLLLTRNTQDLTSEDRQQIAEKVMEEADVDGDEKLSYMEFEHALEQADHNLMDREQCVPQGTMLGPIMFNIYLLIVSIADATAILYTADCLGAVLARVEMTKTNQ